MILAPINARYVLLKDHFSVIRNVFHAPQINFIIRPHSHVKNVVLDVNMMQLMTNAFAKIKPYSSMVLFVPHATTHASTISTKTNAKIVVKIRSIVSPVKSANPVLRLILTLMVINVLLALIKQFGIQLQEIVRLVKEGRYLLQVHVYAQIRRDFGIRLIALNVWFLNSSISLYLNVSSALIGKSMIPQLQIALIAHSKGLSLMAANVLLALQLLSTIPKQKLAKIVHWDKALIQLKRSANARIIISGMIMPAYLALFLTISTSLRSNV